MHVGVIQKATMIYSGHPRIASFATGKDDLSQQKETDKDYK